MKKKKKSKFFNRYTAFLIVIVGIFFAIIARLVFLQVLNSSDYAAQANTDDTREITIPAQRGDILDSKGSPLATDVQSYVLTYTETEESNKKFFTSMQNVLDLLHKDSELQKDTFELKINPYRFVFNTNDPKTEQALELAFKSNRDFRQDAINENPSKFGKNKKYADLSKTQQTQVDQILLKMTPEETFNALWNRYTKSYLNPKGPNYNAATAKLIKSYSTDQKRKFMLVMDAVWMQSFSGYKPVVIADNIKKETAFTIMQKLNDMPGMEVMIQPQRIYPNKNLASSVIGYLSRITGDSQEKYIERGYDVTTDMVGMSGLEASYEDKLKGSTGAKIVKVDKNGRTVGEEAYMPPTKGDTIETTINSTVQKAATEALETQMQSLQANPHPTKDTYTANANRGAVVVQDINTGAIIACVSLPDFDPNNFAVSGRLTTDQQKQYFSPDLEQFGKDYVTNNGLLSAYPGKTLDQVVDMLFPKDTSVKGVNNIRKDPNDIYPKPLFNYALNSLAPPGSTFKPAVAIAGLESGVITTNSKPIDDNAAFDDGKGFHPKFKNDSANGWVSLISAITVSSNPYFMKVGQLLKNNKGMDELAEYAWKLGLGVKPNSGTRASTGIELPESFGQTYNSVSNKNLFAQEYLAATMDELLAGKGERGNTFPAIDLYYHSTESDAVHNLKQQIKNDIQDSIKTKNENKAVYVDLLNKLIAADDSLKGKTFTSNQIGAIADEIGYEAVRRGYYEAINDGNLYNACIGLGMDNFTPMQMAGYIATLVNGGTRYKAHLTNKVMDAEGNVIQQIKPEVLSKANFNPDNVAAIKAGMLGVTGDEGTAAQAFQNFTVMQTGGKTGTATFRQDSEKYLGRTDYAWFVGFAPYDKPEIAVSAVIFDGGYGANAAPIAKAVYEAYFMDQFKKQNYVPDEPFMKELYK